MSFQTHEIPSGPVRRESALQRQMAEFDAKKERESNSRKVSYSEDTRGTSPNGKSSKRNGTPHPVKNSGYQAPPSPDHDGSNATFTRKASHHSPPRSDDEADYKNNISRTGGNGRDKEEKWVGKELPRPRTHGGDNDTDFSHADNIKVSGGGKKDLVQEWNGEEGPRITHHHKWTSDDEEARFDVDEESAGRKKKAPKSRRYKDENGDYVDEADSDNEINTHHKWKPDSEAQANYRPEGKSKKSKKSSRRSSREQNDYSHSGDESDGGIKTYVDKNGDEVQEARNPEKMKIKHNHQWTD